MSKTNSTDLTAERLRELLHYDPETGVFTRKVQVSNAMKGSVAGHLSNAGYWCIKVDNRRYGSHRLAWLYTSGEWPPEDVDHINRRRDDNRLCNLRLASKAENRQNSENRSDNTSGHKGVCWIESHQRWRAQIKDKGRFVYLGSFLNIEDAVAARKRAEGLLHPFAAN